MSSLAKGSAGRILAISAAAAMAHALIAQVPSRPFVDKRVTVTVHDDPSERTTVNFWNAHTSPISAVMVSLKRYKPNGKVAMKWDRFYDSLIVSNERAIQPGADLTIDLGSRLSPNAPKDDVALRVVVFEDGTSSGDEACYFRRRRPGVGVPVFAPMRSHYVDWKQRLEESRPAL